jgi:hypothetical protein
LKNYGLCFLPLILLSCESSTSTKCTNERSKDPACIIHDKANIQDNTPPTVGTKTITTGGSSTTTLSVNWTAAVDDLPGVLEYLVVAVKAGTFETDLQSLQNGLASASDLIFHSEAWTADITSGTVGGLTPATDYFITVLVRDLSGNMAIYEVLSMRTQAVGGTAALEAGTAPVTANITSWEIGLSWGVAKSSADLAISYKVVRAATAAEIDTIDEVEAIGPAGVLLDWKADTTNVTATHLSPATSYAFAVLAQDTEGRKVIYDLKVESTLAAPPFLTMFLSEDTFPVTFASGTGTNPIEKADAICNADSKASGGAYKALIVDSSLRRACLTANCSGANEGLDWVLRPNQEYRRVDREVVMGRTDANGLFPSTLDSLLVDLGLTAMSDAWSGLKADWTTGDNCSNWTAEDAGSLHLGWNVTQDTNYLAQSGSCNYDRYLICVDTQAPTPDTIAPVPGTDLSLSTATSSTIKLSWGRATDNVTRRHLLQYKLVRAASIAAIDTVAEADAITGGNLVMDWTVNVIEATATSLDATTTYAFALLVKDTAGNKALYTPKTYSTKDPGLRIFVTQSSTDGSLTGGAGGTPAARADDMCMNDTNKPNNSTYKAMISSSSRRACTAANCGGATGTEQGQDWVLQPDTKYVRADGSTEIGTTNAQAIFAFPLTAAISSDGEGVLTGLNGNWTTGDNCVNWAPTSSEDNGAVGASGETNSKALMDNPEQCQSLSRPIYCVEQPEASFTF